MAFSCKAVLADYKRDGGLRRVYLQAILDGRKVRIPFAFYVEEHHFQARGNGSIREAHPNARDYNAEIESAIVKALSLASRYRLKRKALTCAAFKDEFENNYEELDLIGYMTKRLTLRSSDFEPGTMKQHNVVINKLREFKKRIPFDELTPELMQRFKNKEIGRGNMPSSIDRVLKVVKHYLSSAEKEGIEFQDPFSIIRIRNYRSNRMSLSEKELNRLDEYYESNKCTPSHKKVLRYFLFSCYTGLRISDIKRITWANISEDLLSYVPMKKKKQNETVTVPLTLEKKYLPDFVPGPHPIFNVFSDPVSNRYLKEIADEVSIKKSITYHTSRHTFGTLMAQTGHLPETQKMMGHGSIRTTMEYVHTSHDDIVKVKRQRFGLDT